MVAILRPFDLDIEDLAELNRLPSVEDLRPATCPLCGTAGRSPRERLAIVGHGTYRRQVLGVVEAARTLVIHVRRYLCRGCQRTISVLPTALLPRRWYSAGAILLALTLSLLRGMSAEEVRRWLGEPGETRGWKTLDRWQRQLFAPLWNWVAAQVGFRGAGPGADRRQRADRLRRLLLHGGGGRSPTEAIEQIVGVLSGRTAHTTTENWLIARAR